MGFFILYKELAKAKKHMDLQYYHAQKHKGHYQESTLCVNVPPKKELLHFLDQFNRGLVNGFVFEIGHTKVIGKDQYDKRIGRLKSSQQLKKVTYTKYSVDKLPDKTLITFFYFPENLHFTLEIKQNRKRVYLVGKI